MASLGDLIQAADQNNPAPPVEQFETGQRYSDYVSRMRREAQNSSRY